MPLLLQNHVDIVKVFLQILTEKYADFETLVEGIYEEIVDGQRNIIHACIDGGKKSDDNQSVDFNEPVASLIDSVEGEYILPSLVRVVHPKSPMLNFPHLLTLNWGFYKTMGYIHDILDSWFKIGNFNYIPLIRNNSNSTVTQFKSTEPDRH